MRPSPKAAKRCRLSEGYGHRDTLPPNWDDPNDPKRKLDTTFRHRETRAQADGLVYPAV